MSPVSSGHTTTEVRLAGKGAFSVGRFASGNARLEWRTPAVRCGHDRTQVTGATWRSDSLWKCRHQCTPDVFNRTWLVCSLVAGRCRRAWPRLETLRAQDLGLLTTSTSQSMTSGCQRPRSHGLAIAPKSLRDFWCTRPHRACQRHARSQCKDAGVQPEFRECQDR